MTQATFSYDSTTIELGNDCYGVWSGSSAANIKKYARTLGGYLKPTNSVDKTVTIMSYWIPPDNATRTEIEAFFNKLNEAVASKSGTLVLSGNSYPNCYVRGIDYDQYLTKDFIRYTIDVLVGNQDSNGTIRQLGVPDLVNWSRGRKATFFTQMEDGNYRAFHFWHNVDSVRNLEVDITQQDSGKDNKAGKVIASGGFERIMCQCWFMTFEEYTRKTIEAYMFNMINGPLGRIGTLCIDAPKNVIGENVWPNVFLEGITQGSDLFNGSRYELNFLSSLQC